MRIIPLRIGMLSNEMSSRGWGRSDLSLELGTVVICYMFHLTGASSEEGHEAGISPSFRSAHLS